MRPMFEAFQANQKNTTGIIQWMLNSAWPEMYWQLYDSFLMPNGAYFGAKKANETIHLLYHYGNNSIHIINNSLNKIENYEALVRIFDINSKQIFNRRIKINLKAESSLLILELTEITKLTLTYFIDLRLIDEDNYEIGNNFYWLSTKKDILDYETEFEEWAFHTPSREYADFTLINSLSKVKLDITYSTIEQNGKDIVSISLENKNSIIAFFIEILLIDKKNQQIILPTIWSDNYVTLLPNEKRIIEADYSLAENKSKPEIKIKGCNLDA